MQAAALPNLTGAENHVVLAAKIREKQIKAAREVTAREIQRWGVVQTPTRLANVELLKRLDAHVEVWASRQTTAKSWVENAGRNAANVLRAVSKDLGIADQVIRLVPVS